MMHKLSVVGVEFLCGVWVLCVLLGRKTARSGRTRNVLVALFVNRALTCRGRSSAIKDISTDRSQRLFRRDRPNNNHAIDVNESGVEKDSNGENSATKDGVQTTNIILKGQ
mmetsp:Transcript_14189/g.17406  ORF Transcript_14189/g.17406 Transcript_14189/m.17406 type:complete len:111 (+) Transcript_14189:112-444(+)